MFDSRSVLTCNYLVWEQWLHSSSLAYIFFFFFFCAFFSLTRNSKPIYASYTVHLLNHFHKIFINLHMKWDICGNLIFFDLYVFLQRWCYHDDWYVKQFGILCRWVLWLFVWITFILFELLRFENNPIDIDCIYICYCIQCKLIHFKMLSIAHWSTVLIMTCTVHELLGIIYNALKSMEPISLVLSL